MRHILRAAILALPILLASAPTAAANNQHHHPTRQQRERYESYYGSVGDPGCKHSIPGVCWQFYTAHFAVPPCIVNDESHGLLHEHSHPSTSSGLYQLDLGNWEHFKQRRWPAFPYEGNKLQQSIVATDVLRSQGIHAWSTAAGCGY